MSVHAPGIFLRSAKPGGYGTITRMLYRLSIFSRGFVPHPGIKECRCHLAHRQSFECALGFYAPVEFVRNVDGCFHVNRIPVFLYLGQYRISSLKILSLVTRACGLDSHLGLQKQAVFYKQYALVRGAVDRGGPKSNF